jgi:signal transduction histidine kinase/ActR/RegA family two-component response regulator
MSEKGTTPPKFQFVYAIVFALMLIIVSSSFIILILHQNSQYFEYDKKVLEESFEDYIDYLRTDLNKVHSRVNELQVSAESDLYESRLSDFQMPFSYKLLKESSRNGIFEYDMDDIEEEHKNFVKVNLTGDGKLRKGDRDFMRTIRMGLNLMDDFDGLKQSVPQIVFAWFIGKEKMIVLFPWLHSSDFQFTEELYNYDPWGLIIPEKNPEKKIQWTNVYFDDAGAGGGLMTTCVVPIYDGEKFIGMIGVDIKVDYLNEVVNGFEPKRNGEMIIYDRKQNILAHPSKLSVNDKSLIKINDIFPEALKEKYNDILKMSIMKLHSYNGYQLLHGKIPDTPFEVIYYKPEKSLMSLIIGKLGWNVIIFLITLQILVVGVLIFTHFKFIRPSERLVNFILIRSKGTPVDRLPKVPKIWKSWFRTVDKVFDENIQLFSNLQNRNVELAENNKKLSANIEKREKTEKENKELEEQLHRSEKMRALGLLAGGVAHDFNNQLQVILSTASVLKLQETENQKQKAAIERILTSTRSSVDLVSQLLAFSKHGKFTIEPVNVHSLIDQVEDLISASCKNKIAVNKELCSEKVVVEGDSTQLQNAIFNIAINAEKAMADGGTLSIKTDNVSINNIPGAINSKLKPGEYIRIELSDTGSGMDKETQSRIFEPYFTTRPDEGLGMGLSVVYGTIESHGGSIDVQSKPGKGTTFTIYLPVASKIRKSEEATQEKKDHSDLKKNILLVDDEKDICISLSEALTVFGFNVVFFHDSRKAVEYYKNSWEQIDLVLLDIIMPDMNGHEVFSEMKKVNPAIKALALSGYSTEEEMNKMLEEGIELLQKPLEVNILARKITSELEKD